ncbi:hypothetical protein [Flavobacterium sp. 5]|uniref:hypothetical protein n=1 Tax=Flavobacterium sp. 5 TaxID=2035199 RepID=UPI000C2C0BE1|nr:hypothetical protein [Flavobacterium sp. 5]PKB15224.1 hypothetical protein CLU82_0288 [Flavobacterium sp. 5]
MDKEAEINNFLLSNSEENINDYSNKLYDNIKELNHKEEKLGLWFVILIFIYLLVGSSSMKEINLGFITISDISTISKLLPLLLIYIFFNTFLITSHKNNLMFALNLISENRFNQIPIENNQKFIGRNFIVNLFFPYSFSNAILNTFSNTITGKPKISETFIGFLLLLPTLLLAILPYLTLILMLVDSYKKYTNDLLGWICFLASVWGFSLLLFYIWISLKNERK